MNSDSSIARARRHPDAFATTQWSLVLLAGGQGNASSRAALEKLCAQYWEPLYSYVHRRVPATHEAQDLTQAFFLRLLEKNYVADADPNRGRFRVFLLSALKHFLSKEWDKAKAHKRGGGIPAFSLDFADRESRVSFEPTSDLTADQLYQRQWVMTLLNRVMQRMQREYERAGKAPQFQCLKVFIGGRGGQYAEAASSLGITEAAARMTVSRMRCRYREILRSEISRTVSSAEEVDEEIRYLFTTFAE